DLLHQLRQVALHRHLNHLECQSTVHRRSHRDLVEKPAINANNRHGPKAARSLDRFTQHMWSIRRQIGRRLYPIDDRIETAPAMRLTADRIDHGYRSFRAKRGLSCDRFLSLVRRWGKTREGTALPPGVDFPPEVSRDFHRELSQS